MGSALFPGPLWSRADKHAERQQLQCEAVLSLRADVRSPVCVRDTISVRFNGEAECFPSCSYLCVASIHLRAHTHTRTYKTNPYLLPFLITLVCIQGKVGATFSCFSSQVNTHSGRFERLTRTFSWANWKPRAWNLQRFALGHASPSQHGPLITAEG